MIDIISLNILVTGGAGTLGHALARKRKEENWTGKMTVYSTDAHKHAVMQREFPDVACVQGDIRNPDTLYNAMVGHDVVIHAAAVKVIPVSEFNSIDTFDVNVNGSQCVCSMALRAGIKQVIGISTDKACHPANAYGASKYLMEKVFQEYSRQGFETLFNLVRFGNVLESNGSVIEMWKNAVLHEQPIKITDPKMTRFWLSPDFAAELVVIASRYPSGCILVPKLPALSLGKLAIYTVGERVLDNSDKVEVRPGEKVHETLLTKEEGWYATEHDGGYIIYPTTYSRRIDFPIAPLSSDIAPEMTAEELSVLLNSNGS